VTAFVRAATLSEPEEELAWQMHVAGVPEPERQYRGIKGRRFAFDFAWPAEQICLEVMGGIWAGMKHTRGQGYTDDCVKANLAVLQGWLYLRVVPDQIASGQALLWVEEAFRVRGSRGAVA